MDVVSGCVQLRRQVPVLLFEHLWPATRSSFSWPSFQGVEPRKFFILCLPLWFCASQSNSELQVPCLKTGVIHVCSCGRSQWDVASRTFSLFTWRGRGIVITICLAKDHHLVILFLRRLESHQSLSSLRWGIILLLPEEAESFRCKWSHRCVKWIIHI